MLNYLDLFISFILIIAAIYFLLVLLKSIYRVSVGVLFWVLIVISILGMLTVVTDRDYLRHKSIPQTITNSQYYNVVSAQVSSSMYIGFFRKCFDVNAIERGLDTVMEFAKQWWHGT
jgi:TctA family transporter